MEEHLHMNEITHRGVPGRISDAEEPRKCSESRLSRKSIICFFVASLLMLIIGVGCLVISFTLKPGIYANQTKEKEECLCPSERATLRSPAEVTTYPNLLVDEVDFTAFRCPNITCSKICVRPIPECPPGQGLVGEFISGHCPTYRCQCSKCLSKGVEHEVGTSWKEDCQNMACSNTADCPTITTEPYNCPAFDETSCTTHGGIVQIRDDTQGCCKECLLCRYQEKREFVNRTINGVNCKTADRINVGTCIGPCPNMSNHNALGGSSEATCACCHPIVSASYSEVFVCDDASKNQE